MPPELLTALRQIRQTMGDAILHDERRVSSFLADLLGNQYPGERRLLKELVVIGIPRMIADGQITATDLPAKAAFVAQQYFWNEAATFEAVRLWYETLQPGAPKPQVKTKPTQAQQSQTEPPVSTPTQPRDTMEELRQRAEQGNDTALQTLLLAAELDDTNAQYNLGQMYYDGSGVTQDWKEAAKWLRRAATQGHAAAQYMLGMMYFLGRGVAVDGNQAETWYRRAAKQGHREAQNTLHHLKMQGVLKQQQATHPGMEKLFSLAKQGDQNALQKLHRIATQGNAKVQFYLGTMYEAGQGIPKDERQAAEWYRKAGEQGQADAQKALGRMYNEGRGVPHDNHQAVIWYRKAALQGQADALHNLGLMYEIGQGVPQDKRQAMELYQKAVSWYRQAAERGHADAQYKLGLLYEYGRGVPNDKQQAIVWLRKSAEQGYADAQYALGLLLIEESKLGIYLHVSKPSPIMDSLRQNCAMYEREATMWFIKAAEQGQLDAQFRAAELYMGGWGVTEDISKCLLLLYNAAERGNCCAQLRLGTMYKYGNYVPKDKRKAIEWYSKAAEQENNDCSQEAKNELKCLKRRSLFWGVFWCLIALGIILLFKWLAW